MRLLVLALSLMFSLAPQEHAAGFHQLAFDNSQLARFGAYSFHLAEPDRPDKPTAWQGPLTISSGGKSCAADVSLVTAVYASADAPFIVVATYSGSNTYVHFIAMSNCAVQWERIKAFTEGVRVANDRLSILPACDSAGIRSPTRCFAACVYKLTSEAAPELLKDESFSLTRETLGVGFTGEAKVVRPKTARARIVAPEKPAGFVSRDKGGAPLKLLLLGRGLRFRSQSSIRLTEDYATSSSIGWRDRCRRLPNERPCAGAGR
jgi:hypothetical protein